MARYKLVLQRDEHFRIPVKGGESSFRLVVSDGYQHYGNLVVSGFFAPIDLSGHTEFVFETYPTALAILKNLPTKEHFLEIECADAVLLQEMNLTTSEHMMEFITWAEMSILMLLDGSSHTMDLSTISTDLVLGRAAYVSDWEDDYMADLADMTLEDMAFAEVIS